MAKLTKAKRKKLVIDEISYQDLPPINSIKCGYGEQVIFYLCSEKLSKFQLRRFLPRIQVSVREFNKQLVLEVRGLDGLLTIDPDCANMFRIVPRDY